MHGVLCVVLCSWKRGIVVFILELQERWWVAALKPRQSGAISHSCAGSAIDVRPNSSEAWDSP